MFEYVVQRLFQIVFVIIGITFVVFAVFYFAPGDAISLRFQEAGTREQVERVRERMGLDQPMFVQYFRFVKHVATGDLGISYVSMQPVTRTVLPALRRTAQLAFTALLLSVIVGVPLGMLLALRRNTAVDYVGTTTSAIGISAPTFWVGLVLIYFVAYQLRWLPSGGASHWYSIILPAATLALHYGAILARMTRSCMLDVLGKDYIRTARAKGLGNTIVTYKHALRNAAVPIVTMMGLQLGNTLGGSILTETVFAWPGIGRVVIEAIWQRDAPVVQAAILIIALVYSLINLLVDLLYVFLNPQARVH